MRLDGRVGGEVLAEAGQRTVEGLGQLGHVAVAAEVRTELDQPGGGAGVALESIAIGG